MSSIIKGFVFINKEGRFAQEGTAGGFARNDKTIRWVDLMHNATVFVTERPWLGHSGKHCEVLKKAQCLRATSETVIKLTCWSDEE